MVLQSIPGLPQSIPKSNAQLTCEAKGGRWDEINKTCILPTPRADPALETFTDPKTGRASGITTPSGKTYLGLGPDDVDLIAQGEAARVARPEGTAPVGTAQRLADENRRKLRLAANVGQIDFETASQLEEQGINIREVIHAGIQGIDLKAAAIAAGAGGAAGASAAVPTGGLSIPATAAIAGGGTLIYDFFNDVKKNIKDQRQDLVTVKTKELRQRKTAMNNYIQAANMNPAESEDFILAYNMEKSLIIRDYNTLVKRGNEDLEFWGTDATPQIVEYQVFFESVQPSLDARMQQAILKPEPTRAFLSIGDENEN